MQKLKASHGEDEKGSDFDLSNILYKNAFDNRIIYIWEEVDDTLSLRVNAEIRLFLEKDKTRDITIMINSPGGQVVDLHSILDDMDIAKKHVTVKTVVCGIAASAAASILVNGTPGFRYAKPSAKVMFHPVSYGLGYDYSMYQERYSEFIRKQEKEFLNHITKCIKFKNKTASKKFLNEVTKSLWLTAREAVELGVVDKIYTG